MPTSIPWQWVEATAIDATDTQQESQDCLTCRLPIVLRLDRVRGPLASGKGRCTCAVW